MIEELAGLSKSPLGNPTRLAIAIYLLSKERTTFSDVRRALKLTPGNLEFHLNALETAGIVRTYYGFGRRPRKFVEITDEGVKELKKVLEILKGVAGHD
jgi:DNA-binding MarR family transcriptional regulator